MTEPRVISRVEPVYPAKARLERIEGRVLLHMLVETDGSISNLEVLEEPAPDLGFSEAALAAVEQWRFKPATQDCRPVAVFLTVEVSFTIPRGRHRVVGSREI